MKKAHRSAPKARRTVNVTPREARMGDEAGCAGPSFWLTKAAFYRIAANCPKAGWTYAALVMIANQKRSVEFTAADQYIARYGGISTGKVRSDVDLLKKSGLIGFGSGMRGKCPKGYEENTYVIASTRIEEGDQQNLPKRDHQVLEEKIDDNKDTPSGCVFKDVAAGAGGGADGPPGAAADEPKAIINFGGWDEVER